MATPLRDLPILLVDLQATGADPDRSHLLELAWSRTRAAEESSPIETTLVALPRGARIPPQVERLTGLVRRDFQGAPDAGRAWALFRSRALDPSPIPLVAHFASFEERHLRALHRREGSGDPFPFELVCTHEIARRLFPSLPRRGIVPLAGFLGHDLDGPKRAPSHVEATRAIWRALVERLEGEPGIGTLEELRSWLGHPPPPRGRKSYPMPKELRLDLPDSPGIYRYRGAAGELLYVGKGASLKARIRSWFGTQHRGDEKSLELLTRVREIETVTTETPLEASLLEADEIKRLRPRYNVSLLEGRGAPRFWSIDLGSSRRRPDRSHPVGPVAPSVDLSAVAAIARLLGGEPDAAPPPRRGLFGGGAERDPEPELLGEGLALLRERHPELAGDGSIRPAPGGMIRPLPSRLLDLGARLGWEQIRAANDDAEPREEEAASGGEEEPEGWTPESCVSALESLLLASARAIRRGRWLARLAEALVRFEDGAEPLRRELLLRGGRIVGAREVPPDTPEGARASVRAIRARALSEPDWDRMRVLSTELKRLVREGRWLSIELPGGARLDRQRLAKLLRWV
jgi:DNA polymerase-3 subunit epsilon